VLRQRKFAKRGRSSAWRPPGSAAVASTPQADPLQPGTPWSWLSTRCYSPAADRPGHVRRAQVDCGGNIQAGQGLTGLDEHQVRRWNLLGRRGTSARLAVVFLTVAADPEHARGPELAGLIPLTPNEIARLLAETIIFPAHDARHQMRWSDGRRPDVPVPRLPRPATHITTHDDLRQEYRSLVLNHCAPPALGWHRSAPAQR
jgi:hypothetical protein